MWPNPQFTADLIIFTEEILNGKLDFLCSVDQNFIVEVYSESYQISKMACFAKKYLTVFSKSFLLRRLTEFWICLSNFLSVKILPQVESISTT